MRSNMFFVSFYLLQNIKISPSFFTFYNQTTQRAFGTRAYAILLSRSCSCTRRRCCVISRENDSRIKILRDIPAESFVRLFPVVIISVRSPISVSWLRVCDKRTWWRARIGKIMEERKTLGPRKKPHDLHDLRISFRSARRENDSLKFHLK